MSSIAINTINRSIYSIIESLQAIKREARAQGDHDRIRRKASQALEDAAQIKRELYRS